MCNYSDRYQSGINIFHLGSRHSTGRSLFLSLSSVLYRRKLMSYRRYVVTMSIRNGSRAILIFKHCSEVKKIHSRVHTEWLLSAQRTHSHIAIHLFACCKFADWKFLIRKIIKMVAISSFLNFHPPNTAQSLHDTFVAAMQLARCEPLNGKLLKINYSFKKFCTRWRIVRIVNRYAGAQDCNNRSEYVWLSILNRINQQRCICFRCWCVYTIHYFGITDGSLNCVLICSGAYCIMWCNS